MIGIALRFLGIAAVIADRRDDTAVVEITMELDEEGRSSDLPCPWCFGPTSEHDTACPTCGEVFGPTT